MADAQFARMLMEGLAAAAGVKRSRTGEAPKPSSSTRGISRNALHRLVRAADRDFEVFSAMVAAQPALVHGKTARGATPLFTAVRKGWREACVELIRNGARIDAAHRDGLTIFHLLAVRNDPALIDLVVGAARARPDDDAAAALLPTLLNAPDTGSKPNYTPLQFAALHGSGLAISALIAYGGDTAVRAADGGTLLHLAAMSGDGDSALTVLLAHGLDVNAVDEDGDTPAHLALAANHLHNVLLLVSAGANLELANKRGDSLLKLVASHPCARSAIQNAHLLRRSSKR